MRPYDDERDEVEILRERLTRLEALVGRTRRAAAIVLAIAALPLLAFVLQDPKGPTVSSGSAAGALRARAFEVVDGEGRVRARLCVDDHEHPQLVMTDGSGRTRVQMTIHDDQQPLLFLKDREGANRVSLICDAHDQPHVLLSEHGGKPRAQLSVGTSGAPGLLFTHRDGGHNAGLGLRADGTAWQLPAPMSRR